MGPYNLDFPNYAENDFYSVSYLGLNCHRNYANRTWSLYSDGANGGVLFRANANGLLNISCIPRTSTSGAPARVNVTDQEVKDRTVARFYVETVENPPNPPTYISRLDIPGTIRAREIRVRLNGWWPDYVFDDTYQLMDFDALRKYITCERHLPGLISAQTALQSEEYDVGTTQLKLLEKIEELTLYILKLEERLKTLETR